MSGHPSYSQVQRLRLSTHECFKRDVHLEPGVLSKFFTHTQAALSDIKLVSITVYSAAQPICCTALYALYIGPLLPHPSKKSDHHRIAAEQILFVDHFQHSSDSDMVCVCCLTPTKPNPELSIPLLSSSFPLHSVTRLKQLLFNTQ